MRTTAAKKRKQQSLFDNEDDGKADQQTSLRSFFAPIVQKKHHRHPIAATTPKPKTKAARVSHSPQAAVTTPSSTEQMYLDLGQRNFGTAECKTCGMLFVHGLQQDTDTHMNVCKDYKAGVSFSNRIKCRATELPQLPSCRIVQVRPSDSSSILREKVQAASRIAYAELGFSNSIKDEDEEKSSSVNARTAYMYIANQRIIGLCLVEQHVQQASRLIQHPDGTLSRASIAEDAVLGVHLLWIHPRHRRQGIANALLNNASETMVYGYVVPPTKVAFSSPTAAGTNFAQRFCGRLDVLVYDCV